ncbi:MAG TPA: prenyltransferase/squalene oxidase repeat-containing protein [Planctomycetota bacterium]|nr:prenyltransferase/squalene oxidase repeat-containing protein [Planctomycetota bacterium]
MRSSPVPPLLLLLLALLAPGAHADDLDKDTLEGMDAEVRGSWVEAVQAFSRASSEAPGDTRKALRLRMARQRGIAVWKPQIDDLMKEKQYEEAARAVAIATLIDADQPTIASAARALEKMGVKVEEPRADEMVSPLFPQRCARGRLRCWSVIGPTFGRATRLVDGGVRFLLAAQEKEGHWSSKKYGGGGLYDAGVTALALQVLVSDGPGGLVGDRGTAARRAADALVAAQGKDGSIGTKATHAYLYCTVIATEALAEYAIVAGEMDRYREPLVRARDHILDAQNRGSGWRYEPHGGESDTSVTGRAVAALHMLRNAGIEVPNDAMEGALAWIDAVVEPEYAQIGYNAAGGLSARTAEKQDLFPADRTAAMTASGALAVSYIGVPRLWLPKSLGLISACPPERRYPDMYYWQLGSRAQVAATGTVPAHWYAALVDAAASCVQSDGGMAASGPWGSDGGRIYATAMTVLALAAPYAEPGPGGKEAAPASQFLHDFTRDVSVAAAASETPTGVYVDPGMRLVVAARGTIQPWVGSPQVAWDGIKHDLKSYRPLIRGVTFGCLLGRIGPEGKPFKIQSEKAITLNGYGELFLLVNDDRPEDGSGAWNVRIKLDN